jgi:hypothetical protein
VIFVAKLRSLGRIHDEANSLENRMERCEESEPLMVFELLELTPMLYLDFSFT